MNARDHDRIHALLRAVEAGSGVCRGRVAVGGAFRESVAAGSVTRAVAFGDSVTPVTIR